MTFETELTADQPRIVSGVKGAKSKPFQKRFKNEAEMARWMDSDAAGDYQIFEVARA